MSSGGELVGYAGAPIGGLRLGLGGAFGAFGGFGGGFLRPGEGAEVQDLGGIEPVAVLAPAAPEKLLADQPAGDHAGRGLAGGAGHFAASLSCSHAFR